MTVNFSRKIFGLFLNIKLGYNSQFSPEKRGLEKGGGGGGGYQKL